MLRKYAQIVDGIVYCIFMAETNVFPPYVEAVDITNLDPQPDPGWIYRGGRFYAPSESTAGFYLHAFTLTDAEVPRFNTAQLEPFTVTLILSRCFDSDYCRINANGELLLTVKQNDNVVDLIATEMQDGVAEFDYYPDLPAGIYYIDLETYSLDLEHHQEVIMLEPIQFMVYRQV